MFNDDLEGAERGVNEGDSSFHKVSALSIPRIWLIEQAHKVKIELIFDTAR